MTKYEAVDICLQNEGSRLIEAINEVNKRLKKGHSSAAISYNSLLLTLAKEKYNLKELGISANTITESMKLLFPDREKGVNSKICNFLLLKNGMRYCHNCKKVKSITEFNKNKSSKHGLNYYCKICQNNTSAVTQRHRTATYRASKIQRTPKWADLDKIKEIYNNVPEGHDVDHIIPLNGENVSGLHVHENLQYLLTSDNIAKSNNYE